MIAYVTKKISVPNQSQICSLACNNEQGWIACGCDSGILKIFKVQSKKLNSASYSTDKSFTMSNQQTLDGHIGSVTHITWNQCYHKFASTDKHGQIIIWKLDEGNNKLWNVEMINDNGKAVSDMKWSPNGERICIVYEEGSILVASLSGNRIWENERQETLKLFEWCPNNNYLLIATHSSHEILIFNRDGKLYKKFDIALFIQQRQNIYDNMTSKENISLRSRETKSSCTRKTSKSIKIVVGMRWYSKGGLQNRSKLAIAFNDGFCILLRKICDTKVLLIESDLILHSCAWNADGTILALGGTSLQDSKCIVKFYNTSGNLVNVLCLPHLLENDNRLHTVCWDSKGLQLISAVDAFIYFAHVQSNHRWAHFGTTLVNAFSMPGEKEVKVMFWNYRSDEKYFLHFDEVLHIESAGNLCLLVTQDLGSKVNEGEAYVLLICDSVGNPHFIKKTKMRPINVALSSSYFAFDDQKKILIWNHTSSSDITKFEGTKGNQNASGSKNFEQIEKQIPIEEVKCFCISNNIIVVADKTSHINIFSLQSMTLKFKLNIKMSPRKIKLNCDETKLSVINNENQCFIFDFDCYSNNSIDVSKPIFFKKTERIYVDVIWCQNEANNFAVVQHGKLLVFSNNNNEPEEIRIPEGCQVVRYRDLEIALIQMDELIESPQAPKKNHFIFYKTKPLQDAKNIITQKGVEEAFHLLSLNRSPKPIWKLLGLHALDEYNFDIAERAYANSEDTLGLEFVRKVRGYKDRMRQHTEILFFKEKFDEAESFFLQMDRKDLAIDLQSRIGHWERVDELSDEIDLVSNIDKFNILVNIGNHYVEKECYSKAASCFLRAGKIDKAIECFRRGQKFDAIEDLVNDINEESILISLARRFECWGLTKLSVLSFIKANDMRSALKLLIKSKDWRKAIQLAKAHNFSEIDDELEKETSLLNQKDDKFGAIELNFKAKRWSTVVQLSLDIAINLCRRRDFVRAKKAYTLAALAIQICHKNTLCSGSASSIESIMSKRFKNAWRGASSCHYFLLAHDQLYSGKIDEAMKCAIRCVEAEDILGSNEVFALVALTSFHNKYFGLCSHAFIKLETISNLDFKTHDAIQTLAYDIFTRHSPQDPTPLREVYKNCFELGHAYTACILSGTSLLNETAVKCQRCQHFMMHNFVRDFCTNLCPLCHSEIRPDNLFVSTVGAA